MLENEAVIFEATPRAPLAAVAIAAIAASWIEAVSPELGAAAINDGIGCVPDGAAAADEAGEGEESGAGGEALAAGEKAAAGEGAAEGFVAPATGDEAAASDGATEGLVERAAAGEGAAEGLAASAAGDEAAAGAGTGEGVDGAAEVLAVSAAGELLSRWEPFWLVDGWCPTDPLGVLTASGSSDAVFSTAVPSAAAGSSAAPRSAVIPGEPSPAARDDSTRFSTRPPQHGSLTRGYLPSQLLLIRPNQNASPAGSASYKTL
jgi:hypothetical protein